MAKLQIKKSNETGKVPQTTDLDWGELALNYADGKLFYKKHGTNTVELLTSVTRLRGTTSGTYTSGDLTLVAGTNITVTQNGSEYTIASAGGADSTKLPLAGGTLTGQLTINAAGTANSPTLRLNTSSSAEFVHTQENLAANLTTGQHAISVFGKVGNTKNSGYIGYYWAGDASNSNFVTIGHWGNDDLFRVYGDGNVTVGTNTVLHAGNKDNYTYPPASHSHSYLPLSGGTLTSTLTLSIGDGFGRINALDQYHSVIMRGSVAGTTSQTVTASDTMEFIEYGGVWNFRQVNTSTNKIWATVNTSGISWDGNSVLHAGNYNSYALPLTGGTLTGALSVALDASIYGITVGRGAGAVAGNTAVGASALAANTTGNGATAIGASAIAGANTSAYATAVGYNALNAVTSGEANAGFGAYSLFKTTSGAYNTGAGVGALQNNITGSNNTAVGYTALVNTTASNNTAVGYQAAYTNQTGARLTALGYQALYNNTANDNTALGWYSLVSNTTGTLNLAVGGGDGATGSTLSNNTTGSYNTGVGFQALKSNTTASNNTAVGYQAGYSNTTGVNLTHIGYQAGYSNTTANNNTIVGFQAGDALTTGGDNTAIGVQALTTGTSAIENTAVGRIALRDTTGNSNTAIGEGSGSAITSGAKNSILGRYNGNQGGLDIRTLSNYIVLSDGDGNPRIVVNGSGNTGVGNPAPTEKLDVAGNIKHTGLTMTAGTNVDQIYTHQQNITLTTGWQDTGVNAAELATGSYIVQVVAVSDYTVGGGHYDEYYTGVMSWFASNTNSTMSDEIALHRAGHAPNNGTIFLRVIRTVGADPDDLKLQIAGTTTNSAAYQYTFKFRRLI